MTIFVKKQFEIIQNKMEWKNLLEKVGGKSEQCIVYSEEVLFNLRGEPKSSSVWGWEPIARLLFCPPIIQLLLMIH